jgi:hypothetical protein
LSSASLRSTIDAVRNEHQNGRHARHDRTHEGRRPRDFAAPLRTEEVRVPAAGTWIDPAKVAACGICHTDLHSANDDWPVTPRWSVTATTGSQHMKPPRSSLDPAYLRWRSKFAPFEASCFEALCEFVRAHFDDLLDRFYCAGHESLLEFPAWAFERYLREAERERARNELRESRHARVCSSNKQGMRTVPGTEVGK